LVQYHSLRFVNNELEYETEQDFGLLDRNGILETARKLYREEIGVK
jgi:hypothetical protein